MARVLSKRSWPWLLLALTLGAATGLLRDSARPASGHALLTAAEPPVNAQLREPPTVLVLHFSEPLERRYSAARVTDQTGARVDDRFEFDDADDAVMRVYLSDVQPGYLSVAWETVSTVDGHRITGVYPLTILKPDGSVPAGTPPASVTLTEGAEADPARVLTRFLLLVSGAALTGALAFSLLVTPGLRGAAGEATRAGFDRWSMLVAALSLVVLVAAGAAELLLQAAELDASAGDVLDTAWGERWLWRNLALIGVAFCVLPALVPVVEGRARRYLAALALAAAIIYLAVTASVSHSAAGAGAFWAAGSDFVHLLAASVWIGMLSLVVALFIWVRRRLPEAARYAVLATALQRFSNVAVISVALLLLSGTFNAIIEVAEVPDLWRGILTSQASGDFPTHGNALFLKLLLLVPLLIVGAVNAYLLRPDLVDEVESPGNSRGRLERLAAAAQRLRELARWELGLALAVLAIVALLVQLTPSRGRLDLPPQGEGRFVASFEEGGIAATLVIDPALAGNNTFEVYLTGAVETVESVRLQFQPNGDVEQESRLIMEPSNPPVFYLGQGPFLSQAGRWDVQIFIRRASGTGADLTLPFSLKLPPAVGAAPVARPAGAFELPVSLSLPAALLLGASAAFSAGIVFVSLRRPGLPAGYAGVIAEQVAGRMPVIRPAWSLAALILFGIGLGLIVGAHRDKPLSSEQARGNNPVEATAESIARGQMLFAANCTQCHGESGRGDGPLAASLSIKPANLYDHIPFHPDQFFFNVIENGVGGVMPAFKNAIAEEDRWNILNYLRATFTEQPAAQ